MTGVVGASRRADVRAHEIAIAAFVALSMPFWMVLMLTLAPLHRIGAAPAIVPGEAVPIRVRPVVDMESPTMLKYGGKKVRAKLPKRWQVTNPPPASDATAQKPKAHVSTRAKDDPDAIPDASVEISDAGTEPTESDAAVTDAGVTDAATEDDDTGDEAAGGGGPGGDPDGSEFGSDAGTSTDPLMKRAARLYHGKISGFLYGGWSCPEGAQPSCTARGTLQISGTAVTGASFSGCGDGVLDGAARAHINSKVGQSIPPPPEKYPGLAPNNFVVSYVCD